MGIDELYKSLNEKDVENNYRQNIEHYFKGIELTSPYNCDGFGKKGMIRILMEFKNSSNLRNKIDLCKILVQCVYYIKRFYLDGKIPPSTIFIGNRNECTVLHVNDVIDYLDMDLDWTLAPSSAYKNTDLLTRLVEDENINPFIFDSKDFTKCMEQIKDLTNNVVRKVLVTSKNIVDVFEYFEKTVLGKNTLNTNEKANLFVQLLVNRDDNYLHPIKRRSKIVTKSFGDVNVQSRDKFQSFFGHFSSTYSPSEKDVLTSVVDRLVEDVTRRKQGEFFTPTIWVDKAHEYITSVYGENWKEEYVVWDPAWGTGNLTRDYKFKELYASTLNQSDIDTANQMGYNPEAVKFQYDFLNDDYEKLPEGLREAIEGGRNIIILMNPPYATSSNMVQGTSKKGVGFTRMNIEMNELKMNRAASQLYTQFFYRLSKIKNINICMFSTPMFMTGQVFKDFRLQVLSKFNFKNGFVIDAQNFEGVKSWPLSFTIWEKNVIFVK